MLKKHLLAASIALTSTTLYAIPIESRDLSGSNVNANNTYTGSNAVNTNEPAVTTNLNWQLMQKNQQLENDIRALRGQLEEQENAINQLNNELSNRYTDLDQRLELLQQKMEPPEPAEGEENTDGAIDANATPEESTATPKQATQPSPSTNTTTSASELEKAAYLIALDAYKQGGAQKAIAPMQNFIKSNPESVYTQNAYFWLAEFYLATTPPNPSEAKKNYSTVVESYPQSSKAPRALYQLYNLASNVDKNPTQAAQYKSALLTKYPNSEEAGFFK